MVFYLLITNRTGVELRIRGIHEHLWKTSFAERNSYNRYEDLLNVSRSDSIENYFGFITSGEVIAPPRLEQTFSQENFSQSRLFTQWDSVRTKIWHLGYIYCINRSPARHITLCSDDTLIFTIGPIYKYNSLRPRC
jgi:hypothetical protein